MEARPSISGIDVLSMGGDGKFSSAPCSWHHVELSINLSDDNSKSWLPPINLARYLDGKLVYPYVLETKLDTLEIADQAGSAFEGHRQNSSSKESQVAGTETPFGSPEQSVI